MAAGSPPAPQAESDDDDEAAVAASTDTSAPAEDDGTAEPKPSSSSELPGGSSTAAEEPAAEEQQNGTSGSDDATPAPSERKEEEAAAAVNAATGSSGADGSSSVPSRKRSVDAPDGPYVDAQQPDGPPAAKQPAEATVNAPPTDDVCSPDDYAELLRPFINDRSGLAGVDKIPGFEALMRRERRPEHRGLLLLIVQETTPELQTAMASSGSLMAILETWLKEAHEARDESMVADVLQLLRVLNVDRACIERARSLCAMVFKTLRASYPKGSNVHVLAERVRTAWRAIFAGKDGSSAAGDGEGSVGGNGQPSPTSAGGSGGKAIRPQGSRELLVQVKAVDDVSLLRSVSQPAKPPRPSKVQRLDPAQAAAAVAAQSAAAVAKAEPAVRSSAIPGMHDLDKPSTAPPLSQQSSGDLEDRPTAQGTSPKPFAASATPAPSPMSILGLQPLAAASQAGSAAAGTATGFGVAPSTTRIGSSSAAVNRMLPPKAPPTAVERAMEAAARIPEPQDEPPRKPKVKKLSWAEEPKLVAVRLFKRDDPAVNVKADAVMSTEELASVVAVAEGSPGGSTTPATPAGFASAARHEHELERKALRQQQQEAERERQEQLRRLQALKEAIAWYPPPLFVIPPEFGWVAGGDSTEREALRQAIGNSPPVRYPTPKQVPPSPAEPPPTVESLQPTESVKIIPIETPAKSAAEEAPAAASVTPAVTPAAAAPAVQAPVDVGALLAQLGLPTLPLASPAQPQPQQQPQLQLSQPPQQQQQQQQQQQPFQMGVAPAVGAQHPMQQPMQAQMQMQPPMQQQMHQQMPPQMQPHMQPQMQLPTGHFNVGPPGPPGPGFGQPPPPAVPNPARQPSGMPMGPPGPAPPPLQQQPPLQPPSSFMPGFGPPGGPPPQMHPQQQAPPQLGPSQPGGPPPPHIMQMPPPRPPERPGEHPPHRPPPMGDKRGRGSPPRVGQEEEGGYEGGYDDDRPWKRGRGANGFVGGRDGGRGRGGAPPGRICAFFNLPNGCRKGVACPFPHVKDEAMREREREREREEYHPRAPPPPHMREELERAPPPAHMRAELDFEGPPSRPPFVGGGPGGEGPRPFVPRLPRRDTPCKYHTLPGGCNKGDNCDFLHVGPPGDRGPQARRSRVLRPG